MKQSSLMGFVLLQNIYRQLVVVAAHLNAAWNAREHPRTHTHIQVHVCALACNRACMHARMHTRALTHTETHPLTNNTHTTYIHLNLHMYARTRKKHTAAPQKKCAYVYTQGQASAHTRTYTRTYLHTLAATARGQCMSPSAPAASPPPTRWSASSRSCCPSQGGRQRWWARSGAPGVSPLTQLFFGGGHFGGKKSKFSKYL